MSNNEQNKKSPIEVIKEIRDYREKNVLPLIDNVRDVKNKIKLAKEELAKKRGELTAIKLEEAQANKVEAEVSAPIEISVAPKSEEAVKEVTKKPAKSTVKETVEVAPEVAKDVAPSAPVEVAPKETVKVETVAPIVNENKEIVEKTPAQPTQRVFVENFNRQDTQQPRNNYNNNANRDNRPQGTGYQGNNQGQGGYNNNRPQGTGYQGNNQGQGGYNNNRPQGTGYQGNNQGGYNNNRPQGTGYQGNNQGGYNNNRPQGTGYQGNNQGGFNNNRPQGTGYQGNNQGGFNNNRPQGTGYQGNNQGGFNNNRPNNGTFAPRVPRLPRANDLMPPPPIAPNRDVNKKKKSVVEEKKTPLNKRTLVRKGYVNEGDFDENGTVRHIKQRKLKKQSVFTPNTVNIENAIVSSLEVPIKTLAERIGKTAIQIVKKCFELGQMHTINDIIDFDTAELIASAFDIVLEYRPDVTAEDNLNAIVHEGVMVKRPPVVTIMGHVDHGKTSLLDYIRESRVAMGEAGGITQHIGAYTIEVKGEQITFLDTPGHEAFTSMRMRGAKITDIAIIVVAADDGIMPQTIEAINHAKLADVSIMVAINKIDKPAANVDKIMQQLTQHNVMPEAWGGDVIVTPVSAKTGQGIDELLESILLLAEVKEIKAIADCPAKGSVIEARLDKGIGPVATVLVQSGTLRVSDYVVAGTCIGKVRALIDDKGRRVKEAKPSHAVSVLGFNEVPNAGDMLVVVEDEKLAKEVASERLSKEREEMQSKSNRKNLEDMFKGMSDGEMKSLGVIIKGDVQGSVEAVKQALLKLNEDMAESGVKITVLHAGVGAINESDIRLADTSNSIVVAFNVRPEPKAKALADKSGVDIKTYRIIYDAIDDVTKAMKGMLDPVYREEPLGHAEVRETFKITNVGTIAGCYITDGKVARNAKFRLIRDNVVVFDGSISSLKRGKDEAREVATGYECGIGLENFNDIKVGDIIEAFLLKEEERI